VLDLSLDAASAGISNERILTKIESINDKVDRFMFQMVERDLNISKEFANRSSAISVNISTYFISLKTRLNIRCDGKHVENWSMFLFVEFVAGLPIQHQRYCYQR
jgi:hypothetical protein